MCVPSLHPSPRHSLALVPSDGSLLKVSDASGTDQSKARLVARKQVSFAETCTVRPTICRKDYSKEEQANTWYSDQEFKTIQSKSLKLVQLIDSGKDLQGRRYCIRGLEGFTQKGYKTKKMNRAAASMIVFDEQENQLFEKGTVSYDVIAFAYEQVTSSSQLWAQTVGMRDWKTAMSCYGKPILPIQRNPASKRPAPKADLTNKTFAATQKNKKQIERMAHVTKMQANAKAA